MIVTAIVIALNEAPFIKACIEAVYPFVTRLLVITNYDRDYYGNSVEPDETLRIVMSVNDPDAKLMVLVYRNIMDEVVQRNWAMRSDMELYRVSHRRFWPHGWSLNSIRRATPQTDYYWIIDGDEIYDPSSVKAMFDFVACCGARVVQVRGYEYFKTWNYRIDLNCPPFWQIGFLRAGLLFDGRRQLPCPRVLGALGRISASLRDRATDLYLGRTRVPEKIGCFHHASYIGDDARIAKKLRVSSHAKDLAANNVDSWFEQVWRKWTPESTNFYFSPHPETWSRADYIPTGSLPRNIRDVRWPAGWIELARG